MKDPINKKTTHWKPLDLITDLGKKIFSRLGLLFLFSFICFVGENNFENQCKKNLQDANSLACFWDQKIGAIGTTLLQAGIVILFIDLNLEKEKIQEVKGIMDNVTNSVQEIFDSVKYIEGTRHIKAFYPKRNEYESLISQNIREAHPGQEIRLLGLFEDLKFITSLNQSLLRDKIISGCKFKILILHPESILVQCLTEVGYNYSNLENPLRTERRTLNNLYSRLNQHQKSIDQQLKINPQDNSIKEKRIKGSFELRLHKDKFSPSCYYSNDNLKLVWIYLFNSEDNEFPGFKIDSPEVIEDFQNHFDCLWERSQDEIIGELLLRITVHQGLNYNNISKFFNIYS